MGSGTFWFRGAAPVLGPPQWDRISRPALAWKILPEAPSPRSQLTDSVTRIS